MRLATTSIAFALLASTASADTPHKIAYMASVEGHCSSLIIGDVDRTGDCPDSLINTAYEDNYSSFKVVVGTGLIVSFFGYDHEAKGDIAHLTVQRIIVTPTPKEEPGDSMADLVAKAEKATRDLKANGDCEYSNPELPDTHVDCTATVDDGTTYSFKFHPTGFKMIG
jgi:hypothetical protein